MPFDLRKTALLFQSYIDQVIRGLDFVYAYIDAMFRKELRHISTTPTDFLEVTVNQNLDTELAEISVNPSLLFECPSLFTSVP